MDSQEIQELHRPIDEQIVQELLSIIPEMWWTICLDVQSSDATAGENGFSLSVSNEEGLPESVMPTPRLYELALEHAALFAKIGKPWKQLAYRVRFDEEIDNWRFEIDYSYG